MKKADYQFSFEKLNVWKQARELTLKVYEITRSFPGDEKFGLVNQIRRSSVSVVANIAEGSSRTSSKDQAHFSQLAYSSLMETLSHFYIASDLNYISTEQFQLLRNTVQEISIKLNTLRKAQLNP
jgi:four helix bundle protein